MVPHEAVHKIKCVYHCKKVALVNKLLVSLKNESYNLRYDAIKILRRKIGVH
jgi:hypothetical protein